MTPDEIKSLRRATGLSQKYLAAALSVEVDLVRSWEKGERFPTRAHCEAMESLRAKPPAPRKKSAERSPMELLADPAFFTLVRKLLAHAALRAEAENLAEEYPDPAEPVASKPVTDKG